MTIKYSAPWRSTSIFNAAPHPCPGSFSLRLDVGRVAAGGAGKLRNGVVESLALRKTPCPLNFSYVRPEPVLVK